MAAKPVAIIMGSQSDWETMQHAGKTLGDLGIGYEALIVSARRSVDREVVRIIDRLGFDVVAVTPASARRIAEAYQRWGRGLHPAALNFGDCFAYEVAKEHACRLLYVGDDFVKTDIEAVL